jgi:hypothetical protein
VKLTISMILMIIFTVTFSLTSYGVVIVLFDENANNEAGAGDILPLFTSHDAGSAVAIEKDAISGTKSISCTAQQSYNPNMGWKYPIDKTPFMTFAWKKDSGKIIMIQMAYDNNWAYRYYCGDNTAGNGPTWAGIQLDKAVPKVWTVYTQDLSKDFAKGWNLTGLALTPWDGKGFYDYLILSTTAAEAKIPTKAVDPKQKVATAWGNIKQL